MDLLRTAPHPGQSLPGGRPAGHPRADVLHGSVAGRRVWRVSCGDVINRDRSITVLVEKNKVVLVGPPGETAVLTSGQLGQLRTALKEAAEQAERSR
ncbi:hypothetical protein SAMN05192558_11961 [Actinokineospora alba]|uniref:Uncharacterized protein n=1 Tax=Actinokineospora alba TaxID=504798 RepID=A0A1H0WAI5_9PSEU|nr:hypothetical protein C8E96_1664 [Actinokineospora alba]SDJ41885.1 hypothetical protein SAMN05421871_11545 [Actinokineospora alba]SDP87779.1 hypothetical protein SAMN05192558_11961 [Actinokineospora alba]